MVRRLGRLRLRRIVDRCSRRPHLRSGPPRDIERKAAPREEPKHPIEVTRLCPAPGFRSRDGECEVVQLELLSNLIHRRGDRRAITSSLLELRSKVVNRGWLGPSPVTQERPGEANVIDPPLLAQSLYYLTGHGSGMALPSEGPSDLETRHFPRSQRPEGTLVG